MEVGRFDLCALFSLQLHHYRVASPSTTLCSVYWLTSTPLVGLIYFACCWNDAVRAIPLFLPNGEHHLSILRLLNKVIDSNQTVCLGDDVHLLRLAVISCRKKEDSKTAELLKDAFHLESHQREDFAIDCFTREATTSEIGLGCVLPPQSERSEPIHLLVLHVVGNFDSLWDFVKASFIHFIHFIQSEISFI